MLISVTLENWMSFNEPVTFSMVAGKQRRHLHRVPKLEKYHKRILPIAAIFGANASGKSNFFKAIEFAENMVTRNLNSQNSGIPVHPYKLDNAKLDQPSRFSFELLIENVIYCYAFAVTKTKVVAESLSKFTSSGAEKFLFKRDENKILFDSFYSDTESELQTIYKGTDSAQLFVHNAASQKRDEFKFIYNWFQINLLTVDQDTSGRIDHNKHINKLNQIIESLDLGFSLKGKNVEITQLPMFEELKESLLDKIPEGAELPYLFGFESEKLTVSRQEGILSAKKIISQHIGSDGQSVEFSLSEESDGSRRAVDLLPAFMRLSTEKSDKVIIIDELDRSLHSLITRQLLESYLENCNEKSRTQLIFTSHDVMLMSRDYLRDDEMWIVDKKSPGDTDMYRLQDFTDIKAKEDVRHTYLSGRLGGVPRLLYAYY